MAFVETSRWGFVFYLFYFSSRLRFVGDEEGDEQKA